MRCLHLSLLLIQKLGPIQFIDSLDLFLLLLFFCEMCFAVVFVFVGFVVVCYFFKFSCNCS